MIKIKKKFTILLLSLLFSPFAYAKGTCESIAFTHWTGTLQDNNIGTKLSMNDLYVDGMDDDTGGKYTTWVPLEYYAGSAGYSVGTIGTCSEDPDAPNAIATIQSTGNDDCPTSLNITYDPSKPNQLIINSNTYLCGGYKGVNGILTPLTSKPTSGVKK